jgi:hypothetical protein
LGFEVIVHPPYNPDLFLDVFDMLGPFKEELSGRNFPTDEDVIDAVQN